MSISNELKEVVIQGGRGLSPKLHHPWADDVLSFSELVTVLDQFSDIPASSLHVRFTGFDLGLRSLRLVEYAHGRSLHPVIEISSRQPILSGKLEMLSKIGPSGVSFALEDVSAPAHNMVTREESWHSTIYCALWARDLGLPVEIRTTARPDLIPRLGDLYQLVSRLGAKRWLVDMLGSPSVKSGLLKAVDLEDAFTALVDSVGESGPEVELRQSPSFRRSMLERARRGEERQRLTDALRRVTIRNSRGQLFVSRQGVVTPDRTLPIPVGDVRNNEIRSLLDTSSLLRSINDPSRLNGKCGLCGLGGLCGGSRARAWRINRDPLSPDPGCPWTPEAVKNAEREIRGSTDAGAGTSPFFASVAE